jgi:exopolysaccharide biosynthesis polyprenyl glycosylphosphotransferase
MLSTRLGHLAAWPASVAGAVAGALLCGDLRSGLVFVGVAALLLGSGDSVATPIALRCGGIAVLALALADAGAGPVRMTAAGATCLLIWRVTLALSAICGVNGAPTVLVGDADAVSSAARLLSTHADVGLRPVATVTPNGVLPTVLTGGAYTDLARITDELGARHILVVSPAGCSALDQAWGLARPFGVTVTVVPAGAELLTASPRLRSLRGLPVLQLAGRRPTRGAAWAAKRVLDRVVAVLALMILLPVFCLVAAAIWFDDGGTVIFRQERVGRDGRLFTMWKFRSMVVGAEAMLDQLQHVNAAAGPYFKALDDPRVTRAGRILRRFYLDELPQLVNVLRGEMSLVGPRPCHAREVEADPDRFSWRRPVLPGMTGPWQVSGCSWLPREEGVRMDLHYVEHWSLWLDLRILLTTVVVALTGDRRSPFSPAGVPVRLCAGGLRSLTIDDDLAPSPVPCDVSVVVVTHESGDCIVDCLESVLTAVERVSFELIVVDNASSDGTAALVAARFPQVRVIAKRGRSGWATNCNIGTAAAVGRHVLLLNPDTIVPSGMMTALADHLDAHPNAGAVGPRLLWPDGRFQPSVRRFPTVGGTLVRRTPLRRLMGSARLAGRHLVPERDLQQPLSVDWLLGAALAVRRSALDELDGLDDGYRLYCEDIDLCWRLQEHGWSVEFLPGVEAIHELREETLKRFFTRLTLWHVASMARFVRLHGFGRPRPVVRRRVPSITYLRDTESGRSSTPTPTAR